MNKVKINLVIEFSHNYPATAEEISTIISGILDGYVDGRFPFPVEMVLAGLPAPEVQFPERLSKLKRN